MYVSCFFFFFQAEDGIRDVAVTGVQTCALPICASSSSTIAASTASSAGPPRDNTHHPASSARPQPSLHASNASSGMSHAPPWTIRDGFIGRCARLAAARNFVDRGVYPDKIGAVAHEEDASDEKIEQEENRSNQHKKWAAVNPLGRHAAQRASKARGDRFQSGLFARAVERSNYRMTRHLSPERTNFILNPRGDVIAVAPEQCGAGNKERIPDDGQKPERRADPPLHVSSLSWPTHSARWTRRPAAGLRFVVNRHQPHDL